MIKAAVLSFFLVGTAQATNFRSCGSGNWNVNATWCAGSYPGNYDNVDIGSKTVVTIPWGYTVMPGSITFDAGTTGNHTTLINQGYIVMTSSINMGTVSSNYAELDMSTGSYVQMSTFNIILDGNGTSYNWLHWYGSASNPVVINSSGGAIVKGAGGGFDNIEASFSYVNFNGMGPWQTAYLTTDMGFAMSHCSYINFNKFTLPQQGTAASPNRYIEYTDFRSPSVGTAIEITATNQVVPTGRNEFFNNTFSSGATLTQGVAVQIDAPGVSVKNNVFNNAQIVTATTYVTSSTITNNIFLSTQQVNACGHIVVTASNTIDSNVFYAECDNPHYWSSIGTNTFTNNVIETNIVGTISDDGDGFMGTPTAGVSTGAVNNNLLIGKRGSSVLLSFLGGATRYDYGRMNNNTIYFDSATSTSQSCFSVGETYNGNSNMYPSLQNNLCVRSSTGTTATATGHILRDLHPGTADQKISTAGYNASFNLGSSLYMGTSTAGSYGVHDIKNVNPKFKGAGSDLLSWDVSLGGPGTSLNVINTMLNQNGYGGAANGAYTVPALLNYLKTKYTPQAAELKGAGFDGTDIGAYPVVPAAGGFFFGAGP